MSFSRFLKVEISRVKPDEEKTRKKKKSRKKSDRHGDDDEDEDNGDENDYEYLFVCNRWLAKNEDDGEIVRELVPSTKSGLKRRNTLSGKCFNFFTLHQLEVDNLYYTECIKWNSTKTRQIFQPLKT